MIVWIYPCESRTLPSIYFLPIFTPYNWQLCVLRVYNFSIIRYLKYLEFEKGYTLSEPLKFVIFVDYISAIVIVACLVIIMFGLIHRRRKAEAQLTRLITEKTGVSKKLLETPMLIEELLTSCSDAILVLDKKGNHVFVNDNVLKILGFSKDEMIGSSSHQLWHHHHLDGKKYNKKVDPIYVALHKGKKWSGSDWLIRNDGAFVPVTLSCSPIFDGGEGNQIVGALIIFSDDAYDDLCF